MQPRKVQRPCLFPRLRAARIAAVRSGTATIFPRSRFRGPQFQSRRGIEAPAAARRSVRFFDFVERRHGERGSKRSRSCFPCSAYCDSLAVSLAVIVMTCCTELELRGRRAWRSPAGQSRAYAKHALNTVTAYKRLEWRSERPPNAECFQQRSRKECNGRPISPNSWAEDE